MLYTEQLSFLDAIAPSDARYKSVASLNGQGFRQEFCLPGEVLSALSRSIASGDNTYLSLCDYVKPRRSGEFVFGFTAFGFDIDCHASDEPAQDAFYAFEHLKQNLFGTRRFPIPSAVEHTGRGLLVLIAFRRAPKQVLPLWLQIGEGFAQAIRDALPPCAALDNTYADTARVVRVPGSYNTRAKRYAEILEDAGFLVYELSELRDRYFPHLNPQSYRAEKPKTEARPDSSNKIIYTDQFIRLHVDRLDDLLRLCESRQYRLEGLRETILFLYRYWTCFYIGPEAALEAALYLNKKFHTPLPEKEVMEATRSAEKAFQRWREDKRCGYNYRNATLIRLLSITPEEQRGMKTIISKEEKARRRADKGQWSNEERDKYRKEKKRQRKEQILEALHAGKKQREICEEFHCDFSFIQRLLVKQTTFEE